ncbi:hypothetical protein [Clostridium sp.]|uniref:DUF7222 domain-containing protein n=1 Tax=Clostridium sp. TaxID=1506 RepID=UPI0025C46D6E|nr:hypothetical protein [Clostridium sp.]
MKKFTKKALNELKKVDQFNNRLEKRVINDLLNTKLSTTELKDHIIDITKYGCISGIVSSLIYYSDTVRFFNNYRQEIMTMLTDPDKNIYFIDTYWIDHTKYSVPEKNSLSWLVYENIVYRIAEYFSLI